MEKQIIEKIIQAKKIVITAHRSPDGDSVGSSTALYNVCKLLGKEVTVCFPDEVPAFLLWVDGAKDIVVFDNESERVKEKLHSCDLLFALDYNGSSRLGADMGALFDESTAFKIMIDHHTFPDDFVDLVYSHPEVCSTCQLIFEVLEKSDRLDLLTPTIATAIYLGIMTDTGSFRFPSLTAKTHLILAKLLEVGVKHYEVHERVFDVNTLDRIKLRGYILSERLELVSDEVVLISMSKDIAEKYNCQRGDTEGLVNEALSIQGMKIAAFFSEADGYIKISFRSKGTRNKVNMLSQMYFNGGGHINAAGGRFDGNLIDAIALFKEKVYEFLDKD